MRAFLSAGVAVSTLLGGMAAFPPRAHALTVLADTIGYTIRDRQMYGPAVRYLVNDTLRGLHAVWKDDTGAVCYNFRPRGSTWRWPDGTLVTAGPRTLGCMDVDPAHGVARIATGYLLQGAPEVSCFSDSAPGAGVFSEQDIMSGYRDPILGAANFGWTRYECTRRDTLYYAAVLSGYPMGYAGPFPAFNLAVSKQTGRWGCIWAQTDGPDRGRLYLKQTPNNGGNWYFTLSLSDSVPAGALSRSFLSACATYDSLRIHLAADLYDGSDTHHDQIWHFCPYNTPQWQLVLDLALPASAQLGDLALAADRPSVGYNRRNGECFIVWEQFDPDNVEPLTGLCRADVWAARSPDSGCTWGEPVRLTRPDGSSKRFPFCAEVVDDTLRVMYFADQVAGCWEQGQGPQTSNPVVCLAVPADELPAGVSEGAGPGPVPAALASVRPAVSPADVRVEPVPGVRLLGVAVYDCAGRELAAPAPAGNSVRWGRGAPPGAYSFRIVTDRGECRGRCLIVR